MVFYYLIIAVSDKPKKKVFALRRVNEPGFFVLSHNGVLRKALFA